MNLPAGFAKCDSVSNKQKKPIHYFTKSWVLSKKPEEIFYNLNFHSYNLGSDLCCKNLLDKNVDVIQKKSIFKEQNILRIFSVVTKSSYKLQSLLQTKLFTKYYLEPDVWQKYWQHKKISLTISELISCFEVKSSDNILKLEFVIRIKNKQQKLWYEVIWSNKVTTKTQWIKSLK